MPRLIIYISLIVFAFPGHCGAAKEKTLGEIRRELLGKEVIIAGIKATGFGSSPEKEVLLDWRIAEKDTDGKYKQRFNGYINKYASHELKGRRGKVISIELVEEFFRVTQSNISIDSFNNNVQDDIILNPYFDLTIQLDDRTLLITRGYYSNAVGNVFEIAEHIDRQREYVLRNINALVGKTIYSTGYTAIFPEHISLREIIDSSNQNIYKLVDVPNLTPVRIAEVQYLTNDHAVLIKIQFLNGRTGIVLSKLKHLDVDSAKKMSLFEKIVHPFPIKIPKEFSRAEIDAIKKGSLFRGMSLSALHYSLGYPKQERDWGTAGKQLIYGDRLFVYIMDKKVVDWQALSR